MTPEFSKAVDPVFLYALQLLGRIEGGECPNAEEERVRVRGWLNQADALLGQGPNWLVAKYGLVSWIDEMLIDAAWGNQGECSRWWKENSLEWELFRSNDRSEKFYVKAKEASSLPRKDVLEVFFIAVVLGFRGMYRDPNHAQRVHEALGLLPDLTEWFRQTSMAIELGRGIPPISDSSFPVEGAPPLDGPFTLIWASAAGLVLTVLAMAIVAMKFIQ